MVGSLESCCAVFDDASDDDVLKLHGEEKTPSWTMGGVTLELW